MKEIYTTHSAEETRAAGQQMAENLIPGTLLTLMGDLGAGKTTLVQGILEGLGAERPYVSPTFVIMKQYDLSAPSATGIKRVYHTDAYRVGVKDFIEMGFAEWCSDPDGLVVLEWPERIKDILPAERIDAVLSSVSETDREIIIKHLP